MPVFPVSSIPMVTYYEVYTLLDGRYIFFHDPSEAEQFEHQNFPRIKEKLPFKLDRRQLNNLIRENNPSQIERLEEDHMNFDRIQLHWYRCQESRVVVLVIRFIDAFGGEVGYFDPHHFIPGIIRYMEQCKTYDELILHALTHFQEVKFRDKMGHPNQAVGWYLRYPTPDQTNSLLFHKKKILLTHFILPREQKKNDEKTFIIDKATEIGNALRDIIQRNSFASFWYPYIHNFIKRLIEGRLNKCISYLDFAMNARVCVDQCQDLNKYITKDDVENITETIL